MIPQWTVNSILELIERPSTSQAWAIISWNDHCYLYTQNLASLTGLQLFQVIINDSDFSSTNQQSGHDKGLIVEQAQPLVFLNSYTGMRFIYLCLDLKKKSVGQASAPPPNTNSGRQWWDLHRKVMVDSHTTHGMSPIIYSRNRKRL